MTNPTTNHRPSLRTARWEMSAAETSLVQARQQYELLEGLVAADPGLRSNSYLMDSLQAAARLYNEMEENLEDCMMRMIEAGYGPEDFKA